MKPLTTQRALADVIAAVKRQKEIERDDQIGQAREMCVDEANKVGQVPSSDCPELLLSALNNAWGDRAIVYVEPNSQREDVVLGGTLKRAGNILVLLRRGRLFTINVKGDQLSAVDLADLAPPAASKDDEYGEYDELLVNDRTVVVIGYSDLRNGIELVLFDLDSSGQLHYRSTYEVRSDDEDSSRSDASRLIGHTLYLYLQFPLPDDAEKLDWLPAIARVRADGSQAWVRRVATLDDVFMAARPLGAEATVHSFVSCDLDAAELSCDGRLLLADPLDTYYPSPSAAYLWTVRSPPATPYAFTAQLARDAVNRPMLYRVPYDGSPITALQVHGQSGSEMFESGDGRLNEVVNDRGRLLLLRVPIAEFGDGSGAARDDQYHALVEMAEQPAVRFLNDRVVIADNKCLESRDLECQVVIAPLQAPADKSLLRIAHSVSRIESIGSGAVAIGEQDGAVEMTSVRLEGKPAVVSSMTFPSSSLDDSHNNAFLYRRALPGSGLFGMALTTPWRQGVQSNAVMQFVRTDDLRLIGAGSFDVSSDWDPDDRCLISCDGWSGDARPLFLGDRIFAAVGYEIIEGRMESDGRVTETRRINFMPRQSRGR